MVERFWAKACALLGRQTERLQMVMHGHQFWSGWGPFLPRSVVSRQRGGNGRAVGDPRRPGGAVRRRSSSFVVVRHGGGGGRRIQPQSGNPRANVGRDVVGPSNRPFLIAGTNHARRGQRVALAATLRRMKGCSFGCPAVWVKSRRLVTFRPGGIGPRVWTISATDGGQCRAASPFERCGGTRAKRSRKGGTSGGLQDTISSQEGTWGSRRWVAEARTAGRWGSRGPLAKRWPCFLRLGDRTQIPEWNEVHGRGSLCLKWAARRPDPARQLPAFSRLVTFHCQARGIREILRASTAYHSGSYARKISGLYQAQRLCAVAVGGRGRSGARVRMVDTPPAGQSLGALVIKAEGQKASRAKTGVWWPLDF